MNKMERTNHGRGLALTMGLASMYVCEDNETKMKWGQFPKHLTKKNGKNKSW